MSYLFKSKQLGYYQGRGRHKSQAVERVGIMRWILLLEKKSISSAFPMEDYPGHVTLSLIPEASAVLQLHGYHVWVCEGNHNTSTLWRWVGSRYSIEIPSEPFEKGYASPYPNSACGVIPEK